MEALSLLEYRITEEEYLKGEETADIRHEYVDGFVRAMAGETTSHNEVAGNIYTELCRHLRGGRCKVFIENIKFRPLPRVPGLFYYPDIMVACDPRDTDPRYRCYPKVVIEVASASTEDKDRGEKMLAYLQNETLEEYVIIAQDRPEAAIYRREVGWVREDILGFQAVLETRSVGLSMTLAQVYEGVLS